ncbi:MAG: hypothetical protein ACOYOS_04330 [Syntrophales bacterium]
MAMTKERYMNVLGHLLREHYDGIKKTGSASSDSQQFINGYLLAGRKLNAVFQKELNDYAEMIHFEIFNMTVAERKKAVPVKPDPSADEPENPDKPDLSENELDIPAYERKGVKLKP